MITSEEADKKEEVEHLREVCGYPSWALNTVADGSKKKKNNKKQMTEITRAK